MVVLTRLEHTGVCPAMCRCCASLWPCPCGHGPEKSARKPANTGESDSGVLPALKSASQRCAFRSTIQRRAKAQSLPNQRAPPARPTSRALKGAHTAMNTYAPATESKRNTCPHRRIRARARVYLSRHKSDARMMPSMSEWRNLCPERRKV